MKLLEHEAKELFARRGLPVPRTGGVIRSAAELPGALKRAGKGPWVLKAQVLAGGRGKAGGIKLAKTAAEARAAAKAILGLKLATHQTHGQSLIVKEVLVDQASQIDREIYLAVAVDRAAALPTMIASSEGGVEIEKLAAERPEAIHRVPFDPLAGLADHQARRLGFSLGVPPDQIAAFVRMAKSLARLFLDLDASLVEVNPLAATPKGLVAIDGKIVTDDNALFRQAALSKRPDREASAVEREAKRVGISYIGLDGNIGCMVNGAGLAMATMDTVMLAGGRPANFLDVGGGATAEQVRRAFQILLKDPQVEAILVNIFGGIMKCDVIAEGILGALSQVKLKIPLVVRLEGTRVEQGKALLAKSRLKLEQASSLWEAAQKAVAAAKR